jgi:hypothetical protein
MWWTISGSHWQRGLIAGISQKWRDDRLRPPTRLALEVKDILVDASSAIADQGMDGRVGDAKVGAQRIRAGIPTGIDLFLSPAWAFDL